MSILQVTEDSETERILFKTEEGESDLELSGGGEVEEVIIAGRTWLI